MKAPLIVTAFVCALPGLSAFGQGYFQFTTGKSQVWDCFSGSVAQPDSTVNTAFLWAANGAVPSVASIMPATPANMTPAIFTLPSAWSAILTDPNFTLAVNNNNGTTVIQRTAANGVISYNGGATFPVQGASVGATYSVYMIGWYAAYATPSLAAAAASVDGYVGWSAPFSYTAMAVTAFPTSFAGLTGQFGVVRPIPEPSLLALAGLGGLSLWLFRRRQ